MSGASAPRAPRRSRRRAPLGALLVAAALLPLSAQAQSGGEPEPTRIGYRGPPDHPARRGLELGVHEANVQGEFLGRRFEIQPLAEGDDAPAGLLAVAAALEPAGLRALAGRGTLVLNLASGDDALRRLCSPDLLHVLPSASMLRAAEARWRAQVPGSSAVARAWHPDFVKFAARDLNARFAERAGAPMGPEAWAGWAAARLLAEAVLRSGRDDPETVRRYLREQLAFDGQKGTALGFGPGGQLRQPVVMVEGERIVGEVPGPGETLSEMGSIPCESAGRD